MNGLRAVTSWARSPLRHFGRANLCCMENGRPYLPTLSNSLMVSYNGIPKWRSYSSTTNPSFERQPRSYWPAIFACVLGIGGATLVYKNTCKDFVSKFLIPTAYCAPNDECGERKCDSSDCLRKNECEEELIKKANSELETAIMDIKGKTIVFTEAALKAYCDAIDALKLAINKVYCAVQEENLDSSRFEEVWCDVNEVLTKRCDLAKVAMEKGECAWELLRRLREIVENGKACKYTSCNPLLAIAEDTLKCAEKEVCAKKTLMEKLLAESRTAEQFRNIVEEFRRDLKAECESLVPSEDCRVTFTDNEANMILTHAYKKILRIQQEKSQAGGDKC